MLSSSPIPSQRVGTRAQLSHPPAPPAPPLRLLPVQQALILSAPIPPPLVEGPPPRERRADEREVAAVLDREEIAMAEAQLQIEHYWAGALRRAVIDGDVENGSLMAGQSVGMLKEEEPVADIITKLMTQSEDDLTRR